MPNYRKAKLLRRSRVFWGSARIWKPRAVFWIGALAIGLVSVLFAKAADMAQHYFQMLTTGGPAWHAYLPLIITPAGFIFCAYMAIVYFPNSQGSGIPQAIAARHLRSHEARERLLSMKVGVGKVALTIVGLFCGASIGREGPTVQVGAAIMQYAARIGGMAQARGLILSGSAAGIAAAFNTPLAGIVFAIEEMSRSFESRANGAVLTAVILSGLAALGLVGHYTYFGTMNEVSVGMVEWALVFICGIGGGILGAAFSGGALYLTIRIKRWSLAAPLKRALLLAGLCGLGVAIIGVAFRGTTFGTGYDVARGALEGQAADPFFFVGKLIAGFLSMISGIPGGIFAPSLAVGAGFGSTVGMVLGTNIGLAALLGMAGYFAGVVQAPMTAFVIILEMTGNHESVIAIMATAMLGYITSRLLSPEPLYHGLSRAFIADSIRHTRASQRAEQDPAEAAEAAPAK